MKNNSASVPVFNMNVRNTIAFCFVLLALFSCNGGDGDVTHEPSIDIKSSRELALDAAIKKYKAFAINHSVNAGFPRSVENNEWKLTHWQSWTDGFLPGILWQLSTVDSSMQVQARLWSEPLENYATMQSHDLGFIINNSIGKGYRLNGEQAYLTT